MKVRFLNANAIKMIAAIAMLIDHIGFLFFPDVLALRAIGRISMPLFAFAIAEGCRYTRNKFRYFSLVFMFGVVYATVYYYIYHEIYLSIFTTFSFSILAVFALQSFKCNVFVGESAVAAVLSGALFFFYVVFLYFLNSVTAIGGLPFFIDYGFWGCMLPVFASLCDMRGVGLCYECGIYDNYYLRLAFYIPGVVLMCLHSQIAVTFFALFAVAILLFYNERKGKLPLKYFFYVFYPAHMAILYLISCLI